MKFHSIKPLRLALALLLTTFPLGGVAQSDQEAQGDTTADAGTADTAPEASPPSHRLLFRDPSS